MDSSLRPIVLRPARRWLLALGAGQASQWHRNPFHNHLQGSRPAAILMLAFIGEWL
jgi:hypothetical protein